METIIEFKDVTKTYQMGEVTVEALKKTNMTIDKGELVVILGASGAGKTTVLNLLGGMDYASSGEIIVDKSNITKFNDKKLTDYRRIKIGFVFQFYNLIANLNALENTEFAAGVCDNPLDSR
ncbi:ABC-type lipoprotein export system ATPase subunit [Cytobacillus purgationiresistens]|uniref:ABC-type lipoprotein export system ATPase subunit n=1 Tax=Cytobacillus purgationiresistens TaxID=863449 RepID=A0ABU0ANB8_9BACI|nr:ABC-type lipoprotein export system ATPase subunit [Cytobacillus purgationiresistens]